MSPRKDPRFHDWTPSEETRKGDLLMHLDYAHERQSRRDFYRWLDNYQYFHKKFTKARLLEIHEKYHAEYQGKGY